MSLVVSHGLTEQCVSGDHASCSGRKHFHNCPCSCHHGLTVAGQCAMWGCDCHEQGGRHGLPFSRRHRTHCVVRIGAAP